MEKKQNSYLRVFFSAFLMFSLIVLPIVIYNHGYMIYYGDFNQQQLPFISHMINAVKNGNFLWDWSTDLGSDFINSYSFYLLGSPFFWISALFPEKYALYTVPWIMALKYAFAALTSYAYIKRFVKNDSSAVIGCFLYAFSGFQAYNIFFNHFHDTTALFPLMLIAMEEHVTARRRGIFALTCTLMALTSYFFFAGQAVFLILYFILRSRCSDFKVTRSVFLSLFAEAVLGTAMSSVILVPAALSVLNNYRVSEHLSGMDMLSYSDRTRVWRIVQSFFMIPDSPARPNLFSEGTSKWSSIAGYLPMFSMTCVLSFMRYKPDSWPSRIIRICMICAFIPVLNSAFYMFNSEYYARWFYMPVLIMALVTAQVFEQDDINPRSGFRVCAMVLAAFMIISLLPGEKDGETVWPAFGKFRAYFYISAGISVLLLAACGYLFRCKNSGKPYVKKGIVFTIAAAFISTSSVFYFGIYGGPYPDRYIASSINDTSYSAISQDDEFFRTDISESCDNYPMFWGYPSVRCFQSTVSPSIMEFYSSLGITRDVASRADTSLYALRGLLSVKYCFSKYEYGTQNEEKELHMTGFEKISDGDNYAVYENSEFIPMGFTYTTYITEEEFEKIPDTLKSNALMHSILISEEQTEKFGSILKENDLKPANLTVKTYLEDCKARRDSACYNFTESTSGFSAEISCETASVVFFSVPYDKGFTAYVNGKKTEIEKVDNGFMAVTVPEGCSEIVFTYFTYGLREGIIITASAALLYIFYLTGGLICTLKKKQRTAA